MDNLLEKTHRCILCNSSISEIIETCDTYKVLKCKDCGLVFVAPIPPKELLYSVYSEDYYKPWIGEQRGKRIKMWEKRSKALNKFSPGGGSLLDVGCAEGLFLEVSQKNGWGVTGTEFSPFAAQYCRDRLGLNVLQGDLTDVGFGDGSFDAVTIWHVLEHVSNPISLLKEIRRIIKDDGVLILAVPNLNNVISQQAYRLVKGKSMRLFSPQDREMHLYHFTTATIKLSLEKAGFRVIKMIPDMGIIQMHIKIMNYIAGSIGFIKGKILTDAVEIHALPIRGGK